MKTSAAAFLVAECSSLSLMWWLGMPIFFKVRKILFLKRIADRVEEWEVKVRSNSFPLSLKWIIAANLRKVSVLIKLTIITT